MGGGAALLVDDLGERRARGAQPPLEGSRMDIEQAGDGPDPGRRRAERLLDDGPDAAHDVRRLLRQLLVEVGEREVAQM